MGRLTLNVLLSFAQFEREVAGERIRDKIAASKKKGMWMGGLPPLGYEVRNRKLVVNQGEAKTLLHIFRRYVELRSVRALKVELDAAGIRSKRRTSPTARYAAATRSPVAPSISCCRTASIAARSRIEATPIPESTRPLWTRPSGTRSRPSSQRTGSTGLPEQP
jgi:hypothetical protein